jgi:hypothetical protein
MPFILGLSLIFLSHMAAAAEVVSLHSLSSGSLIDEVLSQSEDKNAFDWRRKSFSLELGYDYAYESNVFDNHGMHIGADIPVSGGMTWRFGLRRYVVFASEAGDNLAKTPFRQAAQPSRYELYSGISYSLLEGRSFTRLSPWIGDLDHAFFGLLGVHYTHPSKTWLPKGDTDVDPLPGQLPSYSKFNIDAGLRWEVFLPQTFSVFFEFNKTYGTGGHPNLKTWWSFSGGVACAFGS